MKPDEFFEISAFKSPFDVLLEDMAEDDPKRLFLERARAIADDPAGELAARTWAREFDKHKPATLLELFATGKKIGEESNAGHLALLKVLQPAAVGACSINDRSSISWFLAVMAKVNGEFELTRRSYTDVVECARIMNRYFSTGDDVLAQVEEVSARSWAKARQQAGEPSGGSLALLDPADEDPVEEWAELVRWNLDRGDRHDVIAGSDATCRLVLRMEHWCDRMKCLLGLVGPRLVARLACEEDNYWKVRCLTVAGDALLELQEFESAMAAFRLIRIEGESVDLKHPLGIHAVVQEARCHREQDSIVEARELFDLIDKKSLERLGELLASVRGEYVRYQATKLYCLQPALESNAHEQIASGIQFLGPMLGTDRGDRTSYLRMLYFVLLRRDLNKLTR